MARKPNPTVTSRFVDERRPLEHVSTFGPIERQFQGSLFLVHDTLMRRLGNEGQGQQPGVCTMFAENTCEQAAIVKFLGYNPLAAGDELGGAASAGGAAVRAVRNFGAPIRWAG